MRSQVVCNQESDDNRRGHQDRQVGAVAITPLATLDELRLADLEGNRDVASGAACSIHLAHATESNSKCNIGRQLSQES